MSPFREPDTKPTRHEWERGVHENLAMQARGERRGVPSHWRASYRMGSAPNPCPRSTMPSVRSITEQIRMPDRTVVPKVEPLTEAEFHAAMMDDLSRLVRKHGKGKVCLWLGISERQYGNLANGSFPAVHRLHNLLAHDPTAHDAIDREFNRRGVPRDAVCSTDPISAKLASLLSRIVAAEAADSDGGPAVTLAELVHTIDPNLLDDVIDALCGFQERLRAYRNPPRAA